MRLDENGRPHGNDEKPSILFVGRVAPNKKHEDIIAAFHCYKKRYNKDARLFLIGSSGGMERYRQRLEEYVDKLNTEDVIFTGKISFDQLLAYYNISDVFLCMSEHEGFCVPIIEAMYFNLPVIAYSSSAIPATLGGAGILLPEKDPLLTAGVINRVITDTQLREKIVSSQRKRLSDFSQESISEMFKNYLSAFIKRTQIN